MTGGEIIAAGAGVGKAFLGEDSATKDQLAAMAAQTPEMKAAALAYARRVLLKQQILLRVYEPLAKLIGVSREYFEGDFAAELAEEIADIPYEHVTTPSPAVALPAMEGLARSLGEPNLKEMYLRLLAAATDSRRAGDAHPSFAEIIKQLSPEEAGLLPGILRLSGRSAEIVRMRMTARFSPRSKGWDLDRHILPWELYGLPAPVVSDLGPVYIDNWTRLALVEVTSARLRLPHSYEWTRDHPDVSRLRREYGSWRRSVVVIPQSLVVTNFGARFASAVLG